MNQKAFEKLADELNTRFLGQIPLVMEIGEVSDKGLTIYSQSDTSIIDLFEKIVGRIDCHPPASSPV